MRKKMRTRKRKKTTTSTEQLRSQGWVTIREIQDITLRRLGLMPELPAPPEPTEEQRRLMSEAIAELQAQQDRAQAIRHMDNAYEQMRTLPPARSGAALQMEARREWENRRQRDMYIRIGPDHYDAMRYGLNWNVSAQWLHTVPDTSGPTPDPMALSDSEQARICAEKLLREALPEDLYAQLCALGYFKIKAASSAVYTLSKTSKTTIHRPDGSIYSCCIEFAPPSYEHGLNGIQFNPPPGDRVIAEYLLIRSDEQKYLTTANMTCIQESRASTHARAQLNTRQSVGFSGLQHDQIWLDEQIAERHGNPINRIVCPDGRVVRLTPPHRPQMENWLNQITIMAATLLDRHELFRGMSFLEPPVAREGYELVYDTVTAQQIVTHEQLSNSNGRSRLVDSMVENIAAYIQRHHVTDRVVGFRRIPRPANAECFHCQQSPHGIRFGLMSMYEANSDSYEICGLVNLTLEHRV